MCRLKEVVRVIIVQMKLLEILQILSDNSILFGLALPVGVVVVSVLVGDGGPAVAGDSVG